MYLCPISYAYTTTYIRLIIVTVVNAEKYCSAGQGALLP